MNLVILELIQILKILTLQLVVIELLLRFISVMITMLLKLHGMYLTHLALNTLLEAMAQVGLVVMLVIVNF